MQRTDALLIIVEADIGVKASKGRWQGTAIPPKRWKPQVTQEREAVYPLDSWLTDCKTSDLPLLLSRCGSFSLEGLTDGLITCRLPHVCLQLVFSAPSSQNSISSAVCPVFSNAGFSLEKFHKKQDFSLAQQEGSTPNSWTGTLKTPHHRCKTVLLQKSFQ